MPKIEPVFFEKDQISPGGKAAIGITVDGELRAHCIGSGENFREAKACALKHIRTVLKKVMAMKKGVPYAP